MLADAMAKGAPPGLPRQAGEMLAANGQVPALVTSLFATTQQRQGGGDRLVEAHARTLEAALTALRIAADGGDTRALGQVTATRAALERAIAAGGAEPGLLMLVGRAFAMAKLDPGPALQRGVKEGAQAQAERRGGKRQVAADAQAQLAALAEALDHDPFAIHGELSASGAAVPPKQRLGMAMALAGSDLPAMREAALGLALELGEKEAAQVLTALAGPGPVPAALVGRMERLRHWLPEGRRPALETALEALRPRAVDAEPRPRAELQGIHAAIPDGAGAQGLFALFRRAGEPGFASLLIKEGQGVAEAWAEEEMEEEEMEEVTTRVVEELQAVEVPLAFLEARLAAALAENLAAGTPPPFGLLQLVEALGLGSIAPRTVTTGALVEELQAGLPADRTGPEAAAEAQRRVAALGAARLSSWFEGGEEVEALLRPLTVRTRRVEAVLSHLLPGRRAVWAGRCAWAAAALKAAEDPLWVEFALVARDLMGDGAVGEMPVMRMVAEATVSALSARRARR